MIKLKEDGSNFTEWAEEVINHLNLMGMDNIITIGLQNETDRTHPTHALYPEATNFFENHGAIPIEHIENVAAQYYNGEDIQSINRTKDAAFYKYLFGSIDTALQKHLAQITDKTLRRGFLSAGYLINKVTEANSEAVRRAEKDLHTIHLKDFDYNDGKLVTEIRTLTKTIKASGVELRTLHNDIFEAFSDKNLHEDFRLHLKFFEMSHDRGEAIDIQNMLTSLEKKYSNMVKAGKWTKPSKSGIDSRYMSLIATNANTLQENDTQLLNVCHQILLSDQGDVLRKALLTSNALNRNPFY